MSKLKNWLILSVLIVIMVLIAYWPPVSAPTQDLTCYSSPTCATTDILGRATVAAGKWMAWNGWDPKRQKLFGHVDFEGSGSRTPVVVFDAKNNVLETIRGYESKTDKPLARVPDHAFSPSLKYFVIHDEDKKELLLYHTDNLKIPQKVFGLVRIGYLKPHIYSVAWSKNEAEILIKTNWDDNKLYSLNLITGKLVKP